MTWDSTPDAETAAAEEGILVWDFRELLREIAKSSQNQRTYFTDDTLRTIQLYVRGLPQ